MLSKEEISEGRLLKLHQVAQQNRPTISRHLKDYSISHLPEGIRERAFSDHKPWHRQVREVAGSLNAMMGLAIPESDRIEFCFFDRFLSNTAGLAMPGSTATILDDELGIALAQFNSNELTQYRSWVSILLLAGFKLGDSFSQSDLLTAQVIQTLVETPKRLQTIELDRSRISRRRFITRGTLTVRCEIMMV